MSKAKQKWIEFSKQTFDARNLSGLHPKSNKKELIWDERYLYSSDGKRKFFSSKKYFAYERELNSQKIDKMLEEMFNDEKVKKMEKQKQITMKMNVTCVGHPAVINKEGRVKCNKQIEIELPSTDLATNQQAMTKALGEKNWHRLKTRGVFQYFCPTCTNIILDKREESKYRWG